MSNIEIENCIYKVHPVYNLYASYIWSNKFLLQEQKIKMVI